MQRPLLSLIVCSLSTESTALRHEQHTSAASPAEGDGVSVCLAPVSPSCLNKWAQKGGLAKGAGLSSRTVISANGGPLAEWSSGYVTHNEDRLGLRLPQVLFRLNGEKGYGRGMHAVRLGGRRDSCSLDGETQASAPTHCIPLQFFDNKITYNVFMFDFM